MCEHLWRLKDVTDIFKVVAKVNQIFLPSIADGIFLFVLGIFRVRRYRSRRADYRAATHTTPPTAARLAAVRSEFREGSGHRKPRRVAFVLQTRISSRLFFRILRRLNRRDIARWKAVRMVAEFGQVARIRRSTLRVEFSKTKKKRMCQRYPGAALLPCASCEMQKAKRKSGGRRICNTFRF